MICFPPGFTFGGPGSGGASSFSELTGTLANAQVPNSELTIAKLSATGTADNTTFLRGDGTWSAPSGGGLTVVSDTTLVSAATSIDVTGLDIDTDDIYYIYLDVIGALGSNVIARFNGDANDTGYIRFRNATTAVADTFAVKSETAESTGLFGVLRKITDSSGDSLFSFRYSNANRTGDSCGITKTFSGDVNLSQITFTASVSNALGIGTRLLILKG
jgi:hypothetical protein